MKDKRALVLKTSIVSVKDFGSTMRFRAQFNWQATVCINDPVTVCFGKLHVNGCGILSLITFLVFRQFYTFFLILLWKLYLQSLLHSLKVSATFKEFSLKRTLIWVPSGQNVSRAVQTRSTSSNVLTSKKGNIGRNSPVRHLAAAYSR